jgi:ABC-2 type transport system permease protein
VTIKDDTYALQDATAQNYADYILIVEKGYGQRFFESAKEGSDVEPLEVVIGQESVAGAMMDRLIDGYLNTARFYLASGVSPSIEEALTLTDADMAQSTPVEIDVPQDSSPLPVGFLVFMNFSSYTIMLAIVVPIGIILGVLNRSVIRKRTISSPIPSISFNLQVAVACFLVMLVPFFWIGLLGLIGFGSGLAGVSIPVIALMMGALFCYALVSLALAFLVGQVSPSELVTNAIGNITGLVLSFLGGVWIPLEFASATMTRVAHFMPTFYYGDAINRLGSMQMMNRANLMPVFANFGVLLLFAVAIFAVALAVGRLRVRQ